MAPADGAAARPAAAAGGPVDLLCGLPTRGVNPACVGRDLLGDTLGGAVSSAIGEVAGAVVGAANELLAAVLDFLTAPHHPQPQQAWLTAGYARMLGVAGTVAALFFLLGLARAILTSRPAELGRVVAHTVGAFAASGVALGLVQALIVVVDVLSAQVAAGAPSDLAATFTGLMVPLVTLAGGSSGQALLAALMGGFVMLGALAVYLELFVRTVMIHIVVYFLPLMLVGTIWAPTRRWARRSIEFLAVLIVSKFVVYAVIALGWSATAAFDDQRLATSWASVLTGIVLVGVAAYLPWLLFRLLPFMETHVHAAMNRRDARAAATAPVTAASAGMRTLEGNLRHAATIAAFVQGGPAGVAAMHGVGLLARPTQQPPPSPLSRPPLPPLPVSPDGGAGS